MISEVIDKEVQLVDAFFIKGQPHLKLIVLADVLKMDCQTIDNLSYILWDKSVEYFSVYDLLALIARGSYEGYILPIVNVNNAFDLFFSLMGYQERESFSWVRSTVMFEVYRNIQASNTEHSRVHSWFINNYRDFIPDGILEKVISIKRKKPDFTIRIDTVLYPVECKLKFGLDGLKQLKDYMDIWDVNHGFAVAPKLNCELPSNITFIRCP